MERTYPYTHINIYKNYPKTTNNNAFHTLLTRTKLVSTPVAVNGRPPTDIIRWLKCGKGRRVHKEGPVSFGFAECSYIQDIHEYITTHQRQLLTVITQSVIE